MWDMSKEESVRENPAKNRFEVQVDDTLAFLTYHDTPRGTRVIDGRITARMPTTASAVDW